MESEKSYRSSDLGLRLGLLAALKERMLAKLCYNGKWPPPLSMTRCQSSGTPSVAGSFYKAMPKSPSGTEFANYQPTPQNLLPKISSAISCCQLGRCSGIFCMQKPPHALHFRAQLYGLCMDCELLHFPDVFLFYVTIDCIKAVNDAGTRWALISTGNEIIFLLLSLRWNVEWFQSGDINWTFKLCFRRLGWNCFCAAWTSWRCDVTAWMNLGQVRTFWWLAKPFQNKV